MKNQTNEHPLPFSGAMVRAFREGRKNKTRRLIRQLHGFGQITEFRQTDTPGYDWCFRDSRMLWNDVTIERLLTMCPYGVPGDQEWIRETCRAEELRSGQDGVRYRADNAFVPIENTREAGDRWLDLYHYDYERRGKGGWVPWIHAPRWTSRDTALLKGVRIERIQDISEEDAMAEGAEPILVPPDGGSCPHVEGFTQLWDSIHKAHGHGWDANDWVWVLDIERITK